MLEFEAKDNESHCILKLLGFERPSSESLWLHFRTRTGEKFEIYYKEPHLRKIDPENRSFPCTPNDNCFLCEKVNELTWGCTGYGYFCPGGYGDSIYTFCNDCKEAIDNKINLKK